MLLSEGFRHFGRYFFRPVCPDCRACIPIRVPFETYSMTKSARRLFRKNSDLAWEISFPEPTKEAFRIYSKHKNRFGDKRTESYGLFVESFFTPLPGARQLTIYSGGTLVSVGHFDETPEALSAVYTYWDEEYKDKSLGTYTVNLLIRYGLEKGKKYLYLGYYLKDNNHMNYKRRFYPNQISLNYGEWCDYIDKEGNTVLR